MTLNREYQPSSNRVCAYSYVKETELPEGQRLLTCSKCEETCYVDVESQMAHWSLHKKTCCSLAKDNKRIREGLGFDDFEECLRYIETILKAPLQLISGRNLLYAFQQLRSYLLETDVFTGNEDPQKIDDLVHEHVNKQIRRLHKSTQFEHIVEDPLSLAGARQFMRKWTDDYARSSYPTDQGPKPVYRSADHWIMYFSLTDSLKLGCQPCIPMPEGELVPGMTMKQFLRVLLVDDSALFENDPWTQPKIYPELVHLASWQKSHPDHSVWKCLTIEDRLELFELLAKFWCGRDLGLKKLDPDRGDDSLRMDELSTLLIAGNQTKTFISMYHVAMGAFIQSSDPTAEQTYVLEFLSNGRDKLVDDILPSVITYFQSVAHHLKDQNLHPDMAGFEASSFPQELLELIAEYSHGDTFVWFLD